MLPQMIPYCDRHILYHSTSYNPVPQLWCSKLQTKICYFFVRSVFSIIEYLVQLKNIWYLDNVVTLLVSWEGCAVLPMKPLSICFLICIFVVTLILPQTVYSNGHPGIPGYCHSTCISFQHRYSSFCVSVQHSYGRACEETPGCKNGPWFQEIQSFVFLKLCKEPDTYLQMFQQIQLSFFIFLPYQSWVPTLTQVPVQAFSGQAQQVFLITRARVEMPDVICHIGYVGKVFRLGVAGLYKLQKVLSSSLNFLYHQPQKTPTFSQMSAFKKRRCQFDFLL